MKSALATFEIKNWDEQPYLELEGGRKLTRASVKKVFQGELEGDGSVEYLMSYAEDGSATFVGLEYVTGQLAGRSGSFVVQHLGTFAAGVAKDNWTVVAGSGTGDLKGLSGEFRFEDGHAQQYQVTFDYDFK